MLSSLRLGIFLAYKYIRHTNFWTTALVVFVMFLTFLNLVVISGILVGLIEGAQNSYRENYFGDVFISTFPEQEYLERSQFIIDTIRSVPGVMGVSPRYTAGGSLQDDYRELFGRRNRVPDSAGALIAGINVNDEATVTDLRSKIIEGEFLEPGDEDKIVLGAFLLERYIPGEIGFDTLSGANVGDKILMTVGDVEKEMTVKGVIKSKSDPVDLRAYITDRELRAIIGRNDFNVNEIAIRIAPGADAVSVRDDLRNRGLDQYGLVRTNDEAIGDFIEDIRDTFVLLGNIVGAIGLIAASVTVFIVIFITAVTRRKFIGILKGIGISGAAIELSYIILALFYAGIGITLGFALLYGFLVPYFAENPINFPFSDGVLAVTFTGTVMRSVIIAFVTIIAGFIPARIIVSKNTLDSILGR